MPGPSIAQFYNEELIQAQREALAILRELAAAEKDPLERRRLAIAILRTKPAKDPTQPQPAEPTAPQRSPSPPHPLAPSPSPPLSSSPTLSPSSRTATPPFKLPKIPANPMASPAAQRQAIEAITQLQAICNDTRLAIANDRPTQSHASSMKSGAEPAAG